MGGQLCSACRGTVYSLLLQANATLCRVRSKLFTLVHGWGMGMAYRAQMLHPLTLQTQRS